MLIYIFSIDVAAEILGDPRIVFHNFHFGEQNVQKIVVSSWPFGYISN